MTTPRKISNSQLCSAARLALLEGTLSATRGELVPWRIDASVCAVGASLTSEEACELRRAGITGPMELSTLPETTRAIVEFEDPAFAAVLARAHDEWAAARTATMRDRFLALLDLHDPVRALERAALSASPAERATARNPDHRPATLPVEG